MAPSGATVVGIDLAPGLIETAKERAAERGLDIDYRVGDCEQLEDPDASYDAVGSSVGIMFAPHHAAAASELARITKPGGRIALANWTPGSPVCRISSRSCFRSSPRRRRRARSTGATRRQVARRSSETHSS